MLSATKEKNLIIIHEKANKAPKKFVDILTLGEAQEFENEIAESIAAIERKDIFEDKIKEGS